MSTSKSASIPLFVITITTILSLTPSSASSQHSIHETKEVGFLVNLTHRDSPKSPFYNPTLNKSDRIKSAVQRSLSRHHYLQSLSKRRISPNEPLPQVTSEYGEYIMAFSIGSPPVQTYAMADTASELIWLQCLPCQDCYKQKPPIFDPSRSYTYENIGCEDEECLLTSDTFCNTTGNTCAYKIAFEDGSVSSGDLSLDTLTFSDHGASSGEIKLTHMIIGCGHTNILVPAVEVDTPGIIGLNRERASFIKQLTYLSFSYCFVEMDSDLSSQMRFQSEAVLVGGKTPILDRNDSYFLYLEGISVGSTRLPLPEGFFNLTSSGDDGGFVIDSGCSFTLLKSDAYDELAEELKHQVPLELTAFGEEFLLCYKTTLDVMKQVAPDLTLHLSGLDLVLNKGSTWISDGQDRVCLAILPSEVGNLSIFGNFQQQNMNVGYDLKNNVVSFMNLENCDSVKKYK